MSSVKTYINSGNIVFENAEHGEDDLPAILESAILAHFNLRIKVLVYSFEDFKRVAAAIPDNWTNDKDMKSDVWFLWPEK